MKYQKQIRKKISFTIATRKTKYLGTNLTQDVKDLYSENYRTLKKLRYKAMEAYTMFMDWKN